MKKSRKTIFIIITSAIFLLCSVNASSIQISNQKQTIGLLEEWTGEIRIEGETNTIWKGTVSFSNSTIEAENMETHEIETHIISYPSPLGAVDEASKEGGFSYTVVYYPTWDSLLITEIAGEIFGEKTGWVYFVDYQIPMVGADKYELTQEENKVLWGFLYFDNWETQAHALKISVDKTEVGVDEEFTVTVTDDTGSLIMGAVVYINGDSFVTDANGEVTTSIGSKGVYELYAEKDPTPENTYVRSDKTSINVKKARFRSFDLMEYFTYLFSKLKIFS